MNARKKVGLGCLVLAVGVGFWIGPTLFDLKDYIGTAISPQKMREYEGSSLDNLKAIHTALTLYEESEGQFPAGEGWMDSIENRIRTSDMSQQEASKKLRDPLRSKGPDEYGYALNDAAAGKYHEDVPDPSRTPLVFLTSEMGRGVHGDPSKIGIKPEGRAYAITVDGTILK